MYLHLKQKTAFNARKMHILKMYLMQIMIKGFPLNYLLPAIPQGMNLARFLLDSS